MNLRLLLPLVGAALLGLTGCPSEPEPPLVPPAPPTIVSFNATPETATPGGTVTLAWKVEGAQTLRLERVSGGLSLDTIPLEGEHTVTIERDEVFVLSARSEGGQDVRALRVGTGGPQGLLMLAASPAQVRAGEPVTLIYSGPASATGDAALRLENDEGETIPLPASHTGTLTVMPRFDTMYTLRGAGEQTTAQVAVSPAILSATLTRDPQENRRVTVKWEAGGAEAAS